MAETGKSLTTPLRIEEMSSISIVKKRKIEATVEATKEQSDERRRFYLLFDPGSRNAGVVTFVYNETKSEIEQETVRLYTLDIIGEESRWSTYKRKNRQWPFFIGYQILNNVDLREAVDLNTTVVIERQIRDDFIRVECGFYAEALKRLPTTTTNFYSYRMLDARTKLQLNDKNRNVRKQKSIDFTKQRFDVDLQSNHEADCFVLFAYHLTIAV